VRNVGEYFVPQSPLQRLRLPLRVVVAALKSARLPVITHFQSDSGCGRRVASPASTCGRSICNEEFPSSRWGHSCSGGACG